MDAKNRQEEAGQPRDRLKSIAKANFSVLPVGHLEMLSF